MSEPDSTAQTDDPAIHAVERLAAMSIEEVDALPYGFIILDEEGTVLLYNRYEARMSRLDAPRVLSRNFFRDIAPCTRVEAFHGRFRALLRDDSRDTERFSFRFHFLHGAQNVTVQFVKAPAEHGPSSTRMPDDQTGARVFMTIVRQVLEEGGSRAAEIRLDDGVGRAIGPLGAVFPVHLDALPGLLGALGKTAAWALGRRTGTAIAEASGPDLQSVGAEGPAASLQLVSCAFDRALASSGLGRMAFDSTQRAHSGVLGCVVRPAVHFAIPELAAYYEGLLAAAVSATLGAPHRACCLDRDALDVLPWRFALVPEGSQVEIDLGPSERADAAARRLGLMIDSP